MATAEEIRRAVAQQRERMRPAPVRRITSAEEIRQAVAQQRERMGLAPDPASDEVWVRRITSGAHTIRDAHARLQRKAQETGASPGGGGGEDEDEDDDRQRRLQMVSSMRALLAWLPSELLHIYINDWVNHGDAELAWGKVRTSPAYEAHFPGNRREDGSLRMSEQEYLSHREAFSRSLTQWGLNPQAFMNHHVDLVRGDVGVDEFRARLDAKVTGVLQNLPQVRQEFGRFYGIDAMDDTALIAAALDPQVGLDLLQGRIAASQVSAEASAAGFVRSRERAEHLTFAGGLDQMRARQLFSQAADAVPRFSRFAERFNEQRDFGIEHFEEASIFGDLDERQRMRRLQASEEALFRQGGTVRRDQTGLGGLRRR